MVRAGTAAVVLVAYFALVCVFNGSKAGEVTLLSADDTSPAPQISEPELGETAGRQGLDPDHPPHLPGSVVPHVCAKPKTNSVNGYKAVSCGDCDTKYTAIQNRKPIGLKACAAICTKKGCTMFSYGEKTIKGGAGLGCRIATGKTCPNSVDRYCKQTGKSWVKKVIKQQGKAMTKACCGSTQCSKINYYGGILYKPA